MKKMMLYSMKINQVRLNFKPYPEILNFTPKFSLFVCELYGVIPATGTKKMADVHLPTMLCKYKSVNITLSYTDIFVKMSKVAKINFKFSGTYSWFSRDVIAAMLVSHEQNISH
jgi:hypothetical protein